MGLPPETEFLNQRYNGKPLQQRSVKLEKLGITDLLLYYGAGPDIEEDGQTIAHRSAAEKNQLLIRILSLGETQLMVTIAYGNENVANYLWISLNVE
ncbi:hypothetical protein OUZ56_018590 [Daphnia magna]|uniref:DUF4258 domain-containing protein n=1 Tax=Daphnia magna TaxID=35525 RepID=A0ABQ9Z991_9CRUS|nr:hypothetical protein OUZ56_018590 [Daphnia magna]